MKRSQSVLLPLIQRTSSLSFIRPLSLGITGLLLSACGESELSSVVASSVDDCVSSTSLDFEQCDIAYEQALEEAKKTGPSFFNEQDCEFEFGPDGCYQDEGSNYFFPMMAGYLIADKLFDRKKRKYRGSYTPVFGYKKKGSKFYNNYMFADGNSLGSMRKQSFKVSKDAFKPKPSFSRTVSRGGFGQVAAQKARITSRKSSSSRSRSWGG